MRSLLEGEGERSSNHTLADLAEGRRRRVLSILLDRSRPVDEGDLADLVVAAERGTTVADVDPEETRTARVELQHVHLPALADGGLVDRNEADGTATAADHPALRDPAIVRLIETDAEEWDAVIANLSDERRRRALAVLAERDGPMDRFALAREVAAREGDGDGEPPTDAIDEVLCSLHHVDLPKLAEAGLVEYDRNEETVAYAGSPDRGAAPFEYRSNAVTDGGMCWLVRCLG